MDLLRAMQEEVQVDQLSEILKVSPLTIRRDLKELAEEKAIIRTHGGCMLAGRVALDSEYHKKVAKHFELKQKIGRAAAALVKENEVILIDDGSTTFHLATNIDNITPLTIYTNSLVLVSELSRFPDISLNILGGEISQESYSVSGSITERILEDIHFDKVFLGMDWLGENGKCFVKNASSARLATAMLKCSKEKILLGDHTKVKAESGFSYGSLGDFDQWISTPGLEKGELEKYRKMTKVSIQK
ncbi:MAG: DeoR/GlpR transcriptional regulator [Bacteroidetes bacterium]|nr:DeoR/GlpR transcriptional regulator [Bacteroidota bacterium]